MQHNKAAIFHAEMMRMLDDAYKTGAEHIITITLETAQKYGNVIAIETLRRWQREGIENVLGGGTASGESGETARTSTGRDKD